MLWDDYEEDDSDLSVTTAAAMEGDDGLSVTIDDADPVYVLDQSPDDETEYHLEFWLDPNSLNMAANDQFTLVTGKNSIGSALFKVNMAYVGGVYKVTGVVYNDSASTSWTSYAALADGPNKVRIDWGAATEAGANNGYLALWVDDVFHEQVTDVDNDTHELEYVYAGANGGMDVGTSGSFNLDGFTSTNSFHDFLYDAGGSRVLNTLDGDLVVYAGGGYELNVSTGVEKTYYNGFAMREHDLDDTTRTNDSIMYLFKDHLGGTNVVSDISGTLVSETMYMAFGEVRYQSGALPTDMLYTGQRDEASLNLYFYNARWYDPILGRFGQADPIIPNFWKNLAWDKYGYTINNPLKFNDPSGHGYCDSDYSVEVEECWADPRNLDVDVHNSRSLDTYVELRHLLVRNGYEDLVSPSGMILDEVLVAFLLQEVRSITDYTIAFKESVEAISIRYWNNASSPGNPVEGDLQIRNWTSCAGDCTLEEQLSWFSEYQFTYDEGQSVSELAMNIFGDPENGFFAEMLPWAEKAIAPGGFTHGADSSWTWGNYTDGSLLYEHIQNGGPADWIADGSKVYVSAVPSQNFWIATSTQITRCKSLFGMEKPEGHTTCRGW